MLNENILITFDAKSLWKSSLFACVCIDNSAIISSKYSLSQANWQRNFRSVAYSLREKLQYFIPSPFLLNCLDIGNYVE